MGACDGMFGHVPVFKFHTHTHTPMGDGYRQALEIAFEQMSLEGTFERKKKSAESE